MGDEALNGTWKWTQTKEAVADFRQLLLCSKCSKLMNEPVCLGLCEHLLCRSCAGLCAGGGCVVCHSPAWVEEFQINTHLGNITQLFCSLESLLHPTETSVVHSSETEAKSRNQNILKHKKNFKIWFSPRSRKVRCVVQKPSEDVAPLLGPATDSTPEKPAKTRRAETHDLSIFNFNNSSQDSGSGSSVPRTRGNVRKASKKKPRKNGAHRTPLAKPSGRPTRKQTKDDAKKQRLEVINQRWAIGSEEGVSQEEEQEDLHSSKRVSFLNPAASQNSGQEGSPVNTPLPTTSAGGGPCVGSIHVSEDGALPTRSTLTQSACVLVPSDNAGNTLCSPKRTPKRPRAEPLLATPEGTPQRPQVSAGLQKSRTQGCGDPGLLMTPPTRACLKFGESPKSLRGGQGESPSSMGRKPPRSPGGSPLLQGSPVVMKRNHKGETPLHLAAIKGDVEAAKELLDQGADPNLKDNAGWTPLHEACNLGHLGVAELLMRRGALLNTPGYENDSPLHDAVRNGHPAIARLLLQLGASRNVLNLCGKRPADYAVSPEMQEMFRSVSEVAPPIDALASSPSDLPVVNVTGRQDEQMVVLASKLTRPQQKQVDKLVRLLGMKRAQSFSSAAVSHVVVPDGALPTTLSSLQGVLAGCWVLGYSWVEACLREGECVPETEYEAGDGPRRARINKCNLLPPLFDGCFFFLLGSFSAPPKQELLQLLLGAGGRLLSRRPKPDSDVTQTVNAAAYHAAPGSDQALCTQYILYDPRGRHGSTAVRRGKVWSAPATWIVDCIAAFRLLPVPGS